MKRGWSGFRAWPMWAQVVCWVFVSMLAIGSVENALGVGGKTTATAAASPASGGSSSNSETTTTEHHFAPGQRDELHPSPTLTPGATFAVTSEQVCVPGYSESVRHVSDSTRDQVFAEYGLTEVDRGQYEVDHLISLELGGSNDIGNLWPEPLHDSSNNGAADKDELENQLHDLVCSGEVALTDAQVAIVHWDTIDLASLVSTTTTTSTLPPTTPPPTTLPPITAPPVTNPPTTEPPVSPGAGATALCNDGTYSYAAHHQGACSYHGGVAVFYK